jgi:hypothetical protein
MTSSDSSITAQSQPWTLTRIFNEDDGNVCRVNDEAKLLLNAYNPKRDLVQLEPGSSGASFQYNVAFVAQLMLF